MTNARNISVHSTWTALHEQKEKEPNLETIITDIDTPLPKSSIHTRVRVVMPRPAPHRAPLVSNVPMVHTAKDSQGNR
jgi:hypothetical protein